MNISGSSSPRKLRPVSFSRVLLALIFLRGILPKIRDGLTLVRFIESSNTLADAVATLTAACRASATGGVGSVVACFDGFFLTTIGGMTAAGFSIQCM